MASAMDNLAELLSKLRLETDRKGLLKQVTTVLSSVSPSVLEDICENLQLAPLFDCLNADSKEIEIACEALSRMLSIFPPVVIINQYQRELIRGLQHPDTRVKQLVLQQLSRCANDPVANSSLKSADWLSIVISLLAHDDTGIAKCAHQVLISITKHETGLSMLFSATVLKHMWDVFVQSDVIRYRCYDVIVTISKQSDLALHKFVDAGFLPKLISEVDSNDILIQLNCLEMLTELAIVFHGLQYLEEQGVIKKLENMLQLSTTNALIGFLLPGLLKFFGHVGHLHPKEMCNSYQAFISVLYEALNSVDQVLQGVAIQTVGILGSSVDGKFALEKIGPPTKGCIKSLGKAVSNAPSEIRIKALNAIEALLTVKECEQTTETEELLKSWFAELAQQPAELLLGICRQPFTDLHCAALAIFRAIARQYWGQQYMNDMPGFIEYLLDRSTESEKHGKEMKYEIVKTLAESPTSCETLGNIVVLRLREYVREGPFFVKAITMVALEGAD